MATLKLYSTSKKAFVLFRILPGLLTLTLLTSPIWTSILGIHDVVIMYLAFISAYVFYKSAQTTFGNIIGYKRMLRDLARNWSKDLSSMRLRELGNSDQLPENLQGLYHLIFIPIYKEPYEDIKKTFLALAKQDYPVLKNVIIVTTVEERAGPKQKIVIQKLKKEFQKYFFDIWDFYHPENIPGEIVGDACANLRWGAINATRVLEKKNISSKHVIFTKFDSDTRLNPKHLSALTYTYLTNDNRLNKFYSPAVQIYSNNYWRVPAITRVFSSALTLGIVGEWVTDKEKKQSFSCYSSNFKTLERTNYWDASTGAEDTYFYWNTFLYFNGDFAGEEFYLPVTMDAVEGKDYLSALGSLYKQQLRWGWGAIIMSIAAQGMSWNPKIKLMHKFSKLRLLFNVYNLTLTMGILLTFGIPILTIMNQELEFSSTSYLLPRITSIILTASLIFQIPSKYYLWKYYGAPPKSKSFLFKVWWWTLEHFLQFVNIWTYYLLPRIQAQYEMTLGKNRKKFFIAIEGRIS
ncbi:MAG: glycosyltransferase family 2 protein [Patescibacteria group bacterium]|nr:glycosyltransferase family 2 protein [Patescibacteria group bacterium]